MKKKDKEVSMLQLPHGVNKGGEVAKNGKTPSMTISSWQNNNFLIEGVYPADFRNDEGLRIRKNGKSPTLTRGSEKSGTQLNSLAVHLNNNQLKKLNLEINADKSNTLTLAHGRAGSSSEYMDSVSKVTKLTSSVRRLTPVECERLQTVDDNYTNHVSDSQRYKMLGNGWTIDVISHILSYIKK